MKRTQGKRRIYKVLHAMLIAMVIANMSMLGFFVNVGVSSADENLTGPVPSCIDTDADTICDDVDDCIDVDKDDVCDLPLCEADIDADAICDNVDDCIDVDGDTVCDPADNCPDLANPDQANVDGDGLGDACDLPDGSGGPCADSDGDQICDSDDRCLDTDGDGYGEGPGCEGTDCDEANSEQHADCQVPTVPKTANIKAYKVVCESEVYLPNWGQVKDLPKVITSTTAADYVASANAQYGREVCWLQSDWKFQWGFDDKEGVEGVDKVGRGSAIGEADGTPSTGLCGAPYCGPNTETGTEYNMWKTFGPTNASGETSVTISDTEGASHLWVREILETGYIPYTYPPAGPRENDVSAELYCENDVLNYDNYDHILNIADGGTYHCIAFNAPKRVKINAHKVVCESEEYLPNWGQVELIDGEPSRIQFDTAEKYVESINAKYDRRVCWLDKDWKFQWGYNHTGEGEGNGDGVHKLPGDTVGIANGVDTTGMCYQQYCGPNTSSGDAHNEWKSFEGYTNENGAISLSLEEKQLAGETGIWVREVLKPDYIPYTYPPSGPRDNDVSAELYCEDDIVNYDNYDLIKNPVPSGVYNCIAFNAPKKCDYVVEGYKLNHFSGQGEEGWEISVYDAEGEVANSALTDENGHYLISGLCEGDYTVREIQKIGWKQMEPLSSQNKDFYSINLPEDAGTTAYIHNEDTEMGAKSVRLDFVNKPLICGHKFNADGNVGLPDWTITFSETTGVTCEEGDEQCMSAIVLLDTTQTAGDGSFCFEAYHPGIYQVAETMQSGWQAVSDTSFTNEFDGSAPQFYDFVNRRVVQGRSANNFLSSSDNRILSEKVVCDGEAKAKISWETDKNSKSEVQYGEASAKVDAYPFAEADDANTRYHEIIIDGLEAKTYYFRPISGNESGDELVLDMTTCIEEPNKLDSDKTETPEEVVEVLGEFGAPDLLLTKTSDKDIANPGEIIEFTMSVKNRGQISAFAVNLKDILPEGLEFIGDTARDKSWDLGEIAPGETKTVKVSTRVKEDYPAGSYLNNAEVRDATDTVVKASDAYAVEAVKVLAETGFSEEELVGLLLSFVSFLALSSVMRKKSFA